MIRRMTFVCSVAMAAAVAIWLFGAGAAELSAQETEADLTDLAAWWAEAKGDYVVCCPNDAVIVSSSSEREECLCGSSQLSGGQKYRVAALRQIIGDLELDQTLTGCDPILCELIPIGRGQRELIIGGR